MAKLVFIGLLAAVIATMVATEPDGEVNINIYIFSQNIKTRLSVKLTDKVATLRDKYGEDAKVLIKKDELDYGKTWNDYGIKEGAWVILKY